MTSAPDVGGRIRERREALGIPREELAARYRAVAGTRTTTNTLARWERNGRITIDQARILGGLLGVSAQWILHGD